MATLYVENVPDDLYDALKKQAKKNRKSVAAEVIQLLEQFVPTEAELKRRHAFLREVMKFQARKPLTPGPHPSAEEMLRQIRDR